MLGTEVGVKEGGPEVHEALRAAEETLRLRVQVFVEEGEHEPFELRALLAAGVDPVEMLHRKLGRVERMKRLEEPVDAVRVLVHERLAAESGIPSHRRRSPPRSRSRRRSPESSSGSARARP